MLVVNQVLSGIDFATHYGRLRVARLKTNLINVEGLPNEFGPRSSNIFTVFV
jgi:hypothetical protein